MIKHLSLFIFVFLLLPTNIGKAEVVPPEIKEACKREVLKRKPFKVTYTWGELKLNIKTRKGVYESCGSNAAGCFSGIDIPNGSFATKSFPIGEYRCFYPAGSINYHFDASVNISDRYSGCNARAILRHELQHFMHWKSGWEQMLLELQNTLLDRTLFVCKNCSPDAHKVDTYAVLKTIIDKWRNIINTNDARLDEIDHDVEKEVNYRVCHPLGVRTGSFEF